MAKIQLKHAERYVNPAGRLFTRDRVEMVTEDEAAELIRDTTVKNGLKLRIFRLIDDAVPTTAEMERRDALARARSASGKEDLSADLVADEEVAADIAPEAAPGPVETEETGAMTLGDSGETASEQ